MLSVRGEPVSNGTSALLHFFSRTKMIQYLCTKYNTDLSLIFNISIVHCTQTNQSIVNYFLKIRDINLPKVRMLTVNMNKIYHVQ